MRRQKQPKQPFVRIEKDIYARILEITEFGRKMSIQWLINDILRRELLEKDHA